MFWVFLSSLLTPVFSDVLQPPAVHVANWSLTWTSNTQDADVSYTVQFQSTLGIWRDVPSCVQIAVNFCNVTFTKVHADHGCVMLRVKAERHGLASKPAETCIRHGDPCVPQLSLTAQPGSLTLHLSKDHCLAKEHGDHAKHRIYFGKKGEPFKEQTDSSSSHTIKELEEGQEYCAKVQYVIFNSPFGQPSNVLCEAIPFPDSKEKKIAAGVVSFLIFAIVILGIIYLLLFHRSTIKHWIQPPHPIPVDFLVPVPKRQMLISTSINNEQCDVLSVMDPDRLSNQNR